MFRVSEGSHLVPGATSSLRSDTELEDEIEAGGTSSLVALSVSFLNESGDNDAPDEPLSGLVDNPGTTRGTKLSVFADDILSVSFDP